MLDCIWGRSCVTNWCTAEDDVTHFISTRWVRPATTILPSDLPQWMGSDPIVLVISSSTFHPRISCIHFLQTGSVSVPYILARDDLLYPFRDILFTDSREEADAGPHPRAIRNLLELILFPDLPETYSPKDG